jgi:O-antigen/teichoic acid export membrane protein
VGSSTRRFASNALWLIAAEIAGKVASFVFAVIVARGLGPLAYGYFNIAISLGGLVIAFGSLGLNMVVTTEIVKRREAMSETFSSALVGRVGINSIALFAAIAMAPLIVDEGTAVATIALVGAALFVDDISALIGAVFKAVEQMRYRALAIFVNRLVSTGLAVVAVAAGGDILTVCLVYLVGSIAGAAYAAISLRRNFSDLKLRSASRSHVWRLLRAGTPLGVASVLNLAVFRIDTVLLQILRGPLAVAMYGVAFRFFDSLTFLAYSITSAALPRMAKDGNGDEPVRAFQLALGILLTAYLPIAAGAPFAGRWIVVTIFSSRYATAGSATAWLAAGVLFYGVAYLARVAAIAIGRQQDIPKIAAVALAVNVILNLVLIPRLGFEGAAIATFATEVFEMILILIVLKRALPGLRPSRITAVPLVATTALVAVLFLSGARDSTALLIGAPVYLSALCAAAFVIARDQSRRALSILVPRVVQR